LFESIKTPKVLEVDLCLKTLLKKTKDFNFWHNFELSKYILSSELRGAKNNLYHKNRTKIGRTMAQSPQQRSEGG
jgi:hypothetical protein